MKNTCQNDQYPSTDLNDSRSTCQRGIVLLFQFFSRVICRWNFSTAWAQFRLGGIPGTVTFRGHSFFKKIVNRTIETRTRIDALAQLISSHVIHISYIISYLIGWQPSTQASSRYPSYKRRLGTKRDRATPGKKWQKSPRPARKSPRHFSTKILCFLD